jgi:type II secretory pathway pseudopilin PulG
VAVFLILLAILLLLAVQPASTVAQRLKEKELLFRGMEYTEAIRLYQSEHAGAFPAELEDLLKPGPKLRRYIRQLWKNPFDPEGEWGVLAPGSTVVTIDEEGNKTYNFQQGSASGGGILRPGQTQRPGQPSPTPQAPGGAQVPQAGGEGAGQGASGGTAGGAANSYVLPFRLDGGEGKPVVGVYCKLHKRAFSTFLDKSYYDEWYFSPLIVPPPKPVGPPGAPQTPAPGAGTQPPKPPGGGEK